MTLNLRATTVLNPFLRLMLMRGSRALINIVEILASQHCVRHQIAAQPQWPITGRKSAR